MKWGVVDTIDNCWLGDDSGPKLFEDYGLARIAAQVFEVQVFGTANAGTRYQAMEFQPQSLHLKDSVDIRMDGLTALRKLEGYNDHSDDSLKVDVPKMLKENKRK